jgi:hypothetical protein
MGWLGDTFLGKRPDYALLPGVSDSINELQGMNFGLGKEGKVAKHFLRDWEAGSDTSNLGYYEPIRQQLQSNLSDVDMDYSSGANVLNATGGGEQANQINAMRDRQKERLREAAGRQTSEAMGNLAGWASNTLGQANARRDADELRKQQLILQGRGMVYNRNRQGGILPGLIMGGVQAATGFLGGLGGGGGGGAGGWSPGADPSICWVARAIYGDSDPRAAQVREYLLKWERRSLIGAFTVRLYRGFGERIATRKRIVRYLRPLFNYWLKKANELAAP